jgi:hypothetical protein
MCELRGRSSNTPVTVIDRLAVEHQRQGLADRIDDAEDALRLRP